MKKFNIIFGLILFVQFGMLAAQEKELVEFRDVQKFAVITGCEDAGEGLKAEVSCFKEVILAKVSTQLATVMSGDEYEGNHRVIADIRINKNGDLELKGLRNGSYPEVLKGFVQDAFEEVIEQQKAGKFSIQPVVDNNNQTGAIEFIIPVYFSS